MKPPEQEREEERIERLRRAMYSRAASERLRDRPRRGLRETSPVVGDDWRPHEPTLPASRVAPFGISFARKALWSLLGIAALFFAAALLYFAYYFIFGGGASPASPANIDIVISGPPQMAGGDVTKLQIAITNRNRVPLELADLVITYPSGTRLLGSADFSEYACSRPEGTGDPSLDFPRQRVCLGDIEPGGRRQGTVSAVFAGSGGAVTMRAELEYRVAGSSAIFVASSAYQTQLASSPLSLSVSGNKETVSGQQIEFAITIASNANTIVKDALLSVVYPFGFSFSSADPKLADGNLWELGDMRPGEKRELRLRGVLIGAGGDERVFRFSAGIRKDKEEKGISTVLAESAFKMKVTETFLGLGISVNKSSGNAVVAPGGQVNVSINWQNNLSTAIQDAVIVARLAGLQIDGATVLSPDGFYRSSDGVILWDKTTTGGAFSSIAAGARGAVSFSFQAPSVEALANVRNPSLTITVNAAGKRISEKGVPENLQSAASKRIAISSALAVTAQGLYYANPFGSVGPLPPKAGVETTYAIVFTLTNTTNKIDSARLTATLPPYVRWIGIYSPASEIVSFNHGAGTVTWEIGSIEEGVGIGGAEPRHAAIAVGFTPSTSQIGQEPPLLRDIVLTGLDSATGMQVVKRLDDVTSDLIRVSRSEQGVSAAPDPGFSSTQGTVVR